MILSDTQIKAISSSILVIDIQNYIDTHKKEFIQFLEQEENNKERNNN